jgi:hypothetical protein
MAEVASFLCKDDLITLSLNDLDGEAPQQEPNMLERLREGHEGLSEHSLTPVQ